MTMRDTEWGFRNDVRLNRDDLKAMFSEMFETRSMQLMKPLEQQALFVAGKLTQENSELREKMEVILRENEALRSQLKDLPAPAGDMAPVIEEYKRSLAALATEKEALERRLRMEEELAGIIRESEQKFKVQADESSAVIDELEEQIKDIFLEEGRVRASLKSEWEQSMAELREKLQEEEEAKALLKSEWERVCVQLEQKSRPWWKRIFSWF